MATSQEQVTTRAGMSHADIAAMVRQQIEAGQAQVKLQELYEDNFKYRGKNDKLTTEVEELRKKIPAEGAVVLTGDDKAEYEALKALGKDAKALKKVLGEFEALETKVTELDRKTKIAEIADAENWKPSLLERLTAGMDLLGVEEVSEEVDDPDKDGETKKVTVKRGFFNVKGADGKTTGKKKLAEELADFIPALSKAEGEGAESKGGADHGVELPRQSRGDKVDAKGTKSASTSFIGKRYQGPAGKKKD